MALLLKIIYLIKKYSNDIAFDRRIIAMAFIHICL